jgi:hypothetical protein
MRRIGILLCLAALTGCGSGTAVSSRAVTHSPTASGLPDEIIQYTVADIGPGGMGPETVWWDPATGQGRDSQGPSAGIRELVIVNGTEAVQTDWAPPSPVDTSVTSGSRQFVATMSPVSAWWMVRGYLLGRLGTGAQRIRVAHRGGHVVLTSLDGRTGLRVTIVGILRPTAALRRRLFSIHASHVSEHLRQLPAGSQPPAPAAGYWLGPSFGRLRAGDEFIASGPANEIDVGVRYGNDTIDVQTASHPDRAGTAAQMVKAKVLTRPVTCSLADGTPAHASQFRMGPTPPGTFSQSDLRRMAHVRMFSVWTAHAQVTLFAPVSVLSSPAAACRALRPL